MISASHSPVQHGNQTRTQAAQGAQGVQGTAAYLAPERLRGDTLPASDQYAFAILVYEWLCGERPFYGTTLQLYHQHLYATPPRLREFVPTLAPAVEAVVLKALAKDPAHRFADVTEFAQALWQASQVKHQLVLSACYA